MLIASSWMSALIVDPMVRVYGVWQNSQIADFIVRMGNFEKAASKTDANGQFGGTTRYPDYLMRADGTTENRSDTDVQHAMDVGAVAAWATYFAELRGTPDASLRQLANDLYATYDVGVNFWTRPGGTNFNVSPPRRYTWEYKNSPSFSWALTGTDAPGQPGALQFNAASYSVNENQGTATITVTRTGGSAGSVSVNYATSNGTATAGSDYTATSGTLTFADGETSKTFTCRSSTTRPSRIAETVTLTLSNPTGGAALGSPATATLTIDSDDTTNQPITVTCSRASTATPARPTPTSPPNTPSTPAATAPPRINGTQLGVYQTARHQRLHGREPDSLQRPRHPHATPTVSGATLTLNVDTWTANPTIRGYYLLAPWTTAPGSDLGWLHRGTGQDWATPGALGQGTDVVAGKSFVLSGITGSGAQIDHRQPRSGRGAELDRQPERQPGHPAGERNDRRDRPHQRLGTRHGRVAAEAQRHLHRRHPDAAAGRAAIQQRDLQRQRERRDRDDHGHADRRQRRQRDASTTRRATAPRRPAATTPPAAAR